MKHLIKIFIHSSFIFLLILALSVTVYSQSITMNNVTASAGNNVTFTISLNNSTLIESLGLDITYDSSVLSYIDYNDGGLIQNFDFFSGNLIIRISYFIKSTSINPH